MGSKGGGSYSERELTEEEKNLIKSQDASLKQASAIATEQFGLSKTDRTYLENIFRSGASTESVNKAVGDALSMANNWKTLLDSPISREEFKAQYGSYTESTGTDIYGAGISSMYGQPYDINPASGAGIVGGGIIGQTPQGGGGRYTPGTVSGNGNITPKYGRPTVPTVPTTAPTPDAGQTQPPVGQVITNPDVAVNQDAPADVLGTTVGVLSKSELASALGGDVNNLTDDIYDRYKQKVDSYNNGSQIAPIMDKDDYRRFMQYEETVADSKYTNYLTQWQANKVNPMVKTSDQSRTSTQNNLNQASPTDTVDNTQTTDTADLDKAYGEYIASLKAIGGLSQDNVDDISNGMNISMNGYDSNNGAAPVDEILYSAVRASRGELGLALTAYATTATDLNSRFSDARTGASSKLDSQLASIASTYGAKLNNVAADFKTNAKQASDLYGANITKMMADYSGKVEGFTDQQKSDIKNVLSTYEGNAGKAIDSYGANTNKIIGDYKSESSANISDFATLMTNSIASYESVTGQSVGNYINKADYEQSELRRQQAETKAQQQGYQDAFDRVSQIASTRMGQVDQDILAQQRGQQLAGISQSYKETQDQLLSVMGRRGLAGTGVEAGVLTQLGQSQAQAQAQALSNSYNQAIGLSDQRRLQQVGLQQNVSEQGINVAGLGYGQQLSTSQSGVGIAGTELGTRMDAAGNIMSNNALNASTQLSARQDAASQAMNQGMTAQLNQLDSSMQVANNSLNVGATDATSRANIGFQGATTGLGALSAGVSNIYQGNLANSQTMAGLGSQAAQGFMSAGNQAAMTSYGNNMNNLGMTQSELNDLNRTLLQGNQALTQQNIANYQLASGVSQGIYGGASNMLANAGQTANQSAQIAGNTATSIGSNDVSWQKAQMDNSGGVFGAATGMLGNMGAAYLGTLSDKRLKTNIQLVGKENGFNIYTWDWIEGHDYGYNKGVIAQEVMETYPEAVIMTDEGYYAVDYNMIGVSI